MKIKKRPSKGKATGVVKPKKKSPHLEKYHWKPGQSANPSGWNGRQGGNGKSFKHLLRDLFSDSARGKKLGNAKEMLAEVAIDRAKAGDFFFWSKLIDLHEADLVSEDDLNEFVEKVYLIVRRHVEKLDGGKDVLENIARDLQKEEL